MFDRTTSETTLYGEACKARLVLAAVDSELRRRKPAQPLRAPEDAVADVRVFLEELARAAGVEAKQALIKADAARRRVVHLRALLRNLDESVVPVVQLSAFTEQL